MSERHVIALPKLILQPGVVSRNPRKFREADLRRFRSNGKPHSADFRVPAQPDMGFRTGFCLDGVARNEAKPGLSEIRCFPMGQKDGDGKIGGSGLQPQVGVRQGFLRNFHRENQAESGNHKKNERLSCGQKTGCFSWEKCKKTH